MESKSNVAIKFATFTAKFKIKITAFWKYLENAPNGGSKHTTYKQTHNVMFDQKDERTRSKG